MTTYIGTKMIRAEAMTRAAYNEFRSWPLPANESGADEGYLVEYLDGGKPNVPTHAGYVSWSPKQQFEAAYVALSEGADALPPHQQRVVAEKAALSAKYDALHKFINGGAFFPTINSDEQERLRRQLKVMGEYSDILADRISHF